MNTTLRASFAVLTVCSLIAIAGCGTRSRDWATLDPKAPKSDTVKRRVLFAPVDTSPIAKDFPKASVDLARRLADQVTATDAEAWYSSIIPGSADPAWGKGAVPSASGAHLVVLTQVLSLSEDDAKLSGKDPQVKVMVRMRLVGADGKWVEGGFKEAEGGSPNRASPKVMTDADQPRYRAVLDGCTVLMDFLNSYLRTKETLLPPDQSKKPERDLAPPIPIAVSSTPPGADIRVDGILRGTTKAGGAVKLEVPMREILLRIERQGYQIWERRFTPTVDMNLSPALEPLPGSEPPKAEPPKEPPKAEPPKEPPKAEPPKEPPKAEPPKEPPKAEPAPAPAPPANEEVKPAERGQASPDPAAGQPAPKAEEKKSS